MVAHEFFDALPIHIFEVGLSRLVTLYEDGTDEMMVGRILREGGER